MKSGPDKSMTPSALAASASPGRVAMLVCVAAMLSLAVAMGVGRFAFTPLFPLMVRDGLLDSEAGALLAAGNYLGYLLGALLAARIRVKSATLLAIGLICTVAVTAAVGWTSSLVSWSILRFLAGVMSAWSLVATSAWGLGWLAALGRPKLAGFIFAGVGLGIAATGMFCLVVAGPGVSSTEMWTELALFAALAVLLALAVSWRLPAPFVGTGASASSRSMPTATSGTSGLIACYSLFGFGYILPATYLPELARQLVDDPQVFGLAWPLFGIAAALSTLAAAWRLGKTNRLKVWAACHVIMAIGVLLPIIWASLAGVAIAALLVGSTFMVITMVGMQEARSRAPGNATVILGRMTAGFALGQLMGPLASIAIGRFTVEYATALNATLALSTVGLLSSAFYLWQTLHRDTSHQGA